MDPITLGLLVGGATSAVGALTGGSAEQQEAERQARLSRARGQINANMTSANTGLARDTQSGLESLAGQRFQTQQGALAGLPQASAAGGAAEEAAVRRAIMERTGGIVPTTGWGAGVTANAAPGRDLQIARAALVGRGRGSAQGTRDVQNQLQESDIDTGRQAGDLRARNDLLSQYVDRYGAIEGARFADKGPKSGYWDRMMFANLAKSVGGTMSGGAGAMR
jgi:hypothetical protein